MLFVSIDVFCADIGSIKSGNFGWAARLIDGKRLGGDRIDMLVKALIESINNGHKIALGFECPLFVPIRDDPESLTSARVGDANRAWSAAAGTAALAMGVVEVTWLFTRLKEKLKLTPPVFFDWDIFDRSSSGVFVWEAFVSGKAKGKNHIEDATLAVEAFLRCLPTPDDSNAVVEFDVISLAGVAVLRSAWTTELEFLARPCLVIKL